MLNFSLYPIIYLQHLEVAAKLNPEDPPAFRQFAKVANYGFPGGLSAESFMEYAQGFGLDVDRDQAEEIRAAIANLPERGRKALRRMMLDLLAELDHCRN